MKFYTWIWMDISNLIPNILLYQNSKIGLIQDTPETSDPFQVLYRDSLRPAVKQVLN